MVLNKQKKVRLATRPLREFLLKAQRELQIAGSEVTVAFVSDAEIARWNELYRHKKGSTDVLSFPATSGATRSLASPRHTRASGATLSLASLHHARASRAASGAPHQAAASPGPRRGPTSHPPASLRHARASRAASGAPHQAAASPPGPRRGPTSHPPASNRAPSAHAPKKNSGLSRSRDSLGDTTAAPNHLGNIAIAPKHLGDIAIAAKHLGDIAIAPETAKRYARKNGRTLNQELRVLVLHGLLHLLGYDHESDRGEMDRLERKLRRKLGIA